jgi:uncharacterized membrane protein
VKREDPPLDPRMEEMENHLHRIEDRITALQDQLEEGEDSLGWDDLVQQLVGAISFALPFILAQETWEIAKGMGPWRLGVLLILTWVFGYLFLEKSDLQTMKEERILPFLPLRLVTVLLISYTVVLGMTLLFNIYGTWVKDPLSLIKGMALLSVFSVIGAIAVDMAG